MDHKDMLNELELLKSSINRMFLSDDIEEIALMYYWANRRLSAIYKGSLDRLVKKIISDGDINELPFFAAVNCN